MCLSPVLIVLQGHLPAIRETNPANVTRVAPDLPDSLRDMSAIDGVSEIFDARAWQEVAGFEDLTDLTYHRARDHGTVRIAFDRPDVLNAFRPHTVDELLRVLEHARTSSDVGCVLLTGNGPSAKNDKWAFCTGGDQRIRGRAGYQYAEGETADTVDKAKLGRLHILECQRLIRFMPKVVICLVNGWAAGGGHSLHVVSDLTLASREHARFKQTDADVGSFDGGFGSAYLARQVGQKFAREIFFLGDEYDAEDAHRMGAVNKVVPHADLEAEALEWGRKINGKSPTAQRMLKYSFNLIDDGLVGQQMFAGEATRLAYMTDEAQSRAATSSSRSATRTGRSSPGTTEPRTHRGGGAVDPRTTSESGSCTDLVGRFGSAMLSSRSRAASAPICWCGIAIVVKGGANLSRNGMSLKPTTLT